MHCGGLLVFFVYFFFDGHVLEFTGLENLATVETLDEFGIFITRNYLDAWVLTLLIH